MPVRRRLAVPAALLLAVAFAAGPDAQPATWSLLDASPFHSYRFEDGAFISPDEGWIVDGGGRTHRTTDGGATWAHVSTTDEYLRSVAFVSATDGWVGALYGPRRLFETRDGGATLTDVSARIAPALPGGICGLWAVSETLVYGVGQYSGPAYVIRTADGGATWTSRDLSALAGSLVDVYFFDAQRGLAVGGTNGTGPGGRAVVLGTEDGGATWERRFVSTGPQAEWAWKIAFPSPDTGYVSVEYGGSQANGKVLKTTDGGRTWAEVAVPGGGSMQGVGFLTPTVGWTSGRGTVMATADGGATWQPSAELDGQVNRFAFFGDTLGFAMGQRVYRLRAPLPTASAPGPPRGTAALAVSPNPSAGPITVRYALPVAGEVELAVFDLLGRHVATLHEGWQAAGAQVARWERALPPGAYVVRLTAAGAIHAATVTVVGP